MAAFTDSTVESTPAVNIFVWLQRIGILKKKNLSSFFLRKKNVRQYEAWKLRNDTIIKMIPFYVPSK